jgi:hypothetical protein
VCVLCGAALAAAGPARLADVVGRATDAVRIEASPAPRSLDAVPDPSFEVAPRPQEPTSAERGRGLAVGKDGGNRGGFGPGGSGGNRQGPNERARNDEPARSQRADPGADQDPPASRAGR